MKRLFITGLGLLALGILIGFGTSYISHNRTCAADNAQYQTVMRDYGHKNIFDLSKALTQLDKDQCAVESK